MIVEVESFLRYMRLKVSFTTYCRKQWQIGSFSRYLAAHNISYREVRQCDIEQYLISLNCGNGAKKQLCSVIKEFYAFIGSPDNPALQIRFKPDAGRSLPKVPSQPAIEAIIGKLSGLDTELSLRNRLIVELAYGSGLRREEMTRLNIEDVDLEQRTVFVQGKGGKKRIAPVTEKTTTAMRDYLSTRKAYRGPLLVSFMGKRLDGGSLYWIVKHKAGTRPHLLRHACATHMLQNGCGIRAIQELLGHKDLRSTQVYTQIDKTSLREVINRCHPQKSSWR